MELQQKILIVDDEPDMVSLLERIIALKSPYKVFSTSNSLEVPDLLSENRYDVVITDLKMPGMGGLDLLKYIRENDRFEEVIMITAFGSFDTVMEALSHKVLDYITKPFKKEEILFTLDRAMRLQRHRRIAHQVEKVFTIEPYDKALEKFELEYINRLRKRYNDDTQQMVEKSGISSEKFSD